MLNQQFNEVNLGNIGNGVAEELFGRELKAVLKNISDLNTSPTDMRKITLEFSIKPSENREMCGVGIRVRSTLSSVKPVGTSFFLSQQAGKVVAYQHDPKQEELPLGPNVSKIAPKEEALNA